MNYPQLVSMHSFLIRLGAKKDTLTFGSNKKIMDSLKTISENYNDNDAQYLNDCWDKLHIVIKKRKEIFMKNMFMEAKDLKINSFHDYCGIQTLCANTSATINDHRPSNKLMEVIK